MENYIFLENSFFQTKILDSGRYQHLKITAQRYLQEQKFARGYHNTQFMLIPINQLPYTLDYLQNLSEIKLTTIVNQLLIQNPDVIEFFDGVFTKSVA